MTDSAGSICYECRSIYGNKSSRDSHGYIHHGKPKTAWSEQPEGWDPDTPLEDRRGQGKARSGRPAVFVSAPTLAIEPEDRLPWLAYPKTARECALVVGHCEASLKTIRAGVETAAFFESLIAQMRALGIQLRRNEEKRRV